MRARTALVSVAGVVFLAAPLMVASPALAAGCSTGTGTGGSGTNTCSAPVSVTVTVPSFSETLTLSTTAISFGTVVPGAIGSATETWSVSGNDANGFSLQIQPFATAMQGSTNLSDTLPNSALLVTNDFINNAACDPAGPQPFSGSNLATDWLQGPLPCSGLPGGGNAGPITDTWRINVPPNQAPDSYSETFNYVLTAH